MLSSVAGRRKGHPENWEIDVRGTRAKFACLRCAFTCRLFAEHDSRNCPRCDTLMRSPLAPPVRPTKADPKRGNPDTVTVPEWYRCDAEDGCGGMHWAGQTCPLE